MDFFANTAFAALGGIIGSILTIYFSTKQAKELMRKQLKLTNLDKKIQLRSEFAKIVRKSSGYVEFDNFFVSNQQYHYYFSNLKLETQDIVALVTFANNLGYKEDVEHYTNLKPLIGKSIFNYLGQTNSSSLSIFSTGSNSPQSYFDIITMIIGNKIDKDIRSDIEFINS